jgi:PAS domain S-box-containing protein
VGLNVTQYKQAEDDLRESEEKYRLLVESADEAIFTMDADGRYVFVNGSTAARLGKKPQDLIGKTAWDAFPKEIADSQVEQVRQVISSGKGRGYETPTVILGQDRWYKTSINPVRDSAGKVVSALVVARDISERKAAELALQKSEERFRLTFENAVDAIFWADSKTGTLINCNKAAEMLVERTRQEIIGLHFTMLHPPEAVAAHEMHFADQAKNPGTMPLQGQVVTRSGKIVPVHVAASLIPVGSEIIMQGVFRDLTDMNRAWEAVRISQQRLAMVVSNAPIVLLLTDTDGVIQFADGRALASLGFTGEQLVGQSIMDICHDRQAMGQSVRSALGGQDSASLCEVAGRIFNVRLSPLRDDKGGITGVVGVAVDITSRSKAEAALDAARLKLLNVREEEQKRLARDLHDSIGQQLVALKMTFASAGLTEQARKCVELIQETRRLCYDLYPPGLEALGLASALSQLARHYEQAVRIDIECPAEIKVARFGPEREIALFRVAQEAVNNAIRHGKAGTIVLSLACREGQLEMTIADDGCGFDPADQAGKGLGLQTMADRIRAVGGTMGIESGPRRTAIEVRVPLDPPAEC